MLVFFVHVSKADRAQHSILWLCRIRDKIDKMMQKDRALSLLIAMESALEDDRFEVGIPAPCNHGKVFLVILSLV